jgi:hypothetical protein
MSVVSLNSVDNVHAVDCVRQSRITSKMIRVIDTHFFISLFVTVIDKPSSLPHEIWIGAVNMLCGA